jgi:hypothetical protein
VLTLVEGCTCQEVTGCPGCAHTCSLDLLHFLRVGLSRQLIYQPILCCFHVLILCRRIPGFWGFCRMPLPSLIAVQEVTGCPGCAHTCSLDLLHFHQVGLSGQLINQPILYCFHVLILCMWLPLFLRLLQLALKLVEDCTCREDTLFPGCAQVSTGSALFSPGGLFWAGSDHRILNAFILCRWLPCFCGFCSWR